MQVNRVTFLLVGVQCSIGRSVSVQYAGRKVWDSRTIVSRNIVCTSTKREMRNMDYEFRNGLI